MDGHATALKRSERLRASALAALPDQLQVPVQAEAQVRLSEPALAPVPQPVRPVEASTV